MTSITISFPTPGASAQVTCPTPGHPGILPYTSGSANATCHAIGARARLNNGAWKDGSYSSTSPTGGPPYMIAWSVRDVPNAYCPGGNQLDVEIQLSDGTWHAANPVNFTAYCSTMPPPLHVDAPPTLTAAVYRDFSWDLSGLKEGRLINFNFMMLHRVHFQEIAVPPVVEWRSIGEWAGLWRLTMTGPHHAELRLRASITIEGNPVQLEQL